MILYDIPSAVCTHTDCCVVGFYFCYIRSGLCDCCYWLRCWHFFLPLLLLRTISCANVVRVYATNNIVMFVYREVIGLLTLYQFVPHRKWFNLNLISMSSGEQRWGLQRNAQRMLTRHFKWLLFNFYLSCVDWYDEYISNISNDWVAWYHVSSIDFIYSKSGDSNIDLL